MENGFKIEIVNGLIKVDHSHCFDSFFFDDMEDVDFEAKVEVFSNLCDDDLNYVSQNCLFKIDTQLVSYGYATIESLIEQNLNRLSA